MPTAQPSFAGHPLARALSCVLFTFCGVAAASASEASSLFPLRELPPSSSPSLSAVEGEIPFSETIEFPGYDNCWEEGTYLMELDVRISGKNELTLLGAQRDDPLGDTEVSIRQISGDDQSSLTVSLKTTSPITDGGQPPTQLLFDRHAFDGFKGTITVLAGEHTAVVVSDMEKILASPLDFEPWSRVGSRDFARPTLWIDGSFDVKEKVFFTVGKTESNANIAVGGDARLIFTGTLSGDESYLHGLGSVSFDPGAVVLVTEETFAQTQKDWHVLFDGDLKVAGLENLTVYSPGSPLFGNFVVSGGDVIYTTYKARHTGPLAGFATKLVDAMDDDWMPAALRDFLEDELFATASYGYDLGPAVEYMATAHLRTGLEEDMTNDVSSLAPALWRVGKAAKPVLPLWVSEADRKAYEKAWEKATPEERKKLRNPADPLGLSLWVEVTDGTTESEMSAHKRPADRRETDRTGFRLAGVWSRGDDAFGAMMRYEDRTTTVGTHYGTEADSTVTGIALWWLRPVGRGDALLFADWSEATEDLHYSPSSDVYLSARDVNPTLYTLGGLYSLPVGTDDAWRVFGAASIHRMSDYSHEWEASGDTIVREKTDARIFASLGLGARWEGGLFPNVKWLEGWTGFAEVSVWGYAGELRREGRIEAPWAEKELSDSWRGSEMARVRGEGSFGVRGSWRNYRFTASGRFAGGADGYESRSWMITVGRQY